MKRKRTTFATLIDEDKARTYYDCPAALRDPLA
jgi:hypothetical protein